MPETNKAEPRTLYVRRDVVNAAEIIKWAKAQGFKTTLPASDMHVTVAYSHAPVDWMQMGESWYSNKDGKLEVAPGGARLVEQFDKGAVVVLFNSSELTWRHMAMRERGATWEHDEYQPHITITYEPGDVDLAKVEPYRGKIVLGPEIFEEIEEDWADGIVEKGQVFATMGQIAKLDSDLRVVWGWASVYEEKGEAVVDSHGDVIEEAAILKGAHTFIADVRAGKAMHVGRRIGTVVESLVFTRSLQTSLGIDLGKSGWFIGMKIEDPDIWDKVKDGTYAAFSFGGMARREEMEPANA
jgi:hypothetical protein